MAVTRRRPLHERIPPLGWLRKPVRDALFAFIAKIANTDDAKAIAASTLGGLLNGQQDLLGCPGGAAGCRAARCGAGRR